MDLEVAERWFDRKSIDSAITMLIEPHVDPLMQSNIWHVRGRDCDLLIDGGMGVASLRAAAPDLFKRPLKVVATHTHWDHAGGLHEFDTCMVHPAEADILAHGDPDATLLRADMDPVFVAEIEASDCPVPEVLISALPVAGYDIGGYSVQPVRNVVPLDAGDRIDLGDRVFEVLHLPGHSPGGIGLWELETGILFSGDALYDAPLLDTIPGADIGDYIETLKRLRALPVSIVHAGHEPSFGRDRLIELVDENLARWEAR
jgi:glyoxylase-like metal-dependent hydrolase (beta-lactamase superfamily II)